MQTGIVVKFQRVVTLLTYLLVLKVTGAVLWGYGNYFPPTFATGFLHGREDYFFGRYQWAFYAHILSGPLALLTGIVLVSHEFRRRFPLWHRMLGRVQVINVLCVVVPSGIWMAFYAAPGVTATVAFVLLALATGITVLQGYRAVVGRHFARHQRWMMRCFLLLCSAVVIRLIGGLGTVMGVESPWYDRLASWVSWIVPLALFELLVQRRRQTRSSLGPGPPTASRDAGMSEVR